MSAMFNYFKQFTSALNKESPKISECCATYLRAYPNMVYVLDGSASTKLFLFPDAMECFTYIYPNRYCSAAQFNDFCKIINQYLKCQSSTTRLFNELKREQPKNIVPVFPVHWYVIAKIPIFEVLPPTEENVKEEVEAGAAVEEAKEAEVAKEVETAKDDNEAEEAEVKIKEATVIEDSSDEYDSFDPEDAYYILSSSDDY